MVRQQQPSGCVSTAQATSALAPRRRKQLHIHNSSTTEAQIQFTDSGTGSTASDGMRVGWNGTLGQIYVYENADLRFCYQ